VDNLFTNKIECYAFVSKNKQEYLPNKKHLTFAIDESTNLKPKICQNSTFSPRFKQLLRRFRLL
jgi:hypothetical protein